MPTMKALVKKYPKPGLWMDEAEIPVPGPNDVLIKIKKTAICGTDVHIYEWNDWARNTIKTPMIIGHEYVGEVAGFGGNVHDVKLGELVSGEGHLICGVCRNCRGGIFHLCKNTSGVGVNRQGAFAEYITIPVSNVWHCGKHKHIDPEIYAIFDPFGNAVHTALSFDILGEDVLITGAGPIGIMAALIAIHARARHVVLTDIIPYRLSLARKLGIKHAIDTREAPLSTKQAELGMKEGFDVGMEMSGSGAAFNEMVTSMKHGGKIALLGIPSGDMRVDWNTIVFNGLTLKGIYGREMFETWYKMQMLLETGLDIAPVITHRFHVKEFEKGFDAMISGNSGKVILDWDA